MTTKNILQGVRAFSPLLHAYEAGHSIEEIKANIIGILEPEFENVTMLDRYGIDLLAVEAVNVGKIRNSDWASRLFDECLQIRRKYFAIDEDGCARVYAAWEESIGTALSLYWNNARFEHQKADLPLDEFAFEIFRNIGALIEGTLQVYLKELLHIIHKLQNDIQTFSDINSLSLGTIVSRIGEKSGLAPYLTLPPWNVHINQWRNIAQHYSMNTSKDLIAKSPTYNFSL